MFDARHQLRFSKEAPQFFCASGRWLERFERQASIGIALGTNLEDPAHSALGDEPHDFVVSDRFGRVLIQTLKGRGSEAGGSFWIDRSWLAVRSHNWIADMSFETKPEVAYVLRIEGDRSDEERHGRSFVQSAPQLDPGSILILLVSLDG